jgi:ABC-type sugar transport system substrate-binding protein
MSKWIVLALLGIASIAVLVGGCGGGSDSSSGSTATETGSGSTTEEASAGAAKEFVESHLTPPTEIPITTAAKQKPESGKSIVYVDCGNPVCNVIGEGIKEVTDLFGWNLKTISAGSSQPEEVLAAFEAAVQAKPDAIISDGIAKSLFKKPLEEMKAMNIPYVAGAVVEKPAGAQIATVVGQTDYEEKGEWMANWVVSQTGQDGKVVLFNIPDFPALAAEEEGFKKTLTELCPGCELETEAVNATEIGTKFPSKVVSYLQSHPDTNYMVTGFGDMLIGVPQAMSAAGITGVGSVSASGEIANYEAIANGLQDAEVPEQVLLFAWDQVDPLVRYFNKEPMLQEQYESLPKNYITQENVETPPTVYEGVKDFRKQF